jgi:signal transduction histidine kinase
LVVDDEPRNLGLVEAILEGGGAVEGSPLEVTCVSSGVSAIEQFGASMSMRPFDLVLLDVMMPELDGFSVLSAMRALTPADERIPIVMVTALGSRDDRMKGLELGADDFLSKPVDPNELRCRARTFLSLRRAQRVLKQHADDLHALQRAKAELTGMIVHDLKNPLAAVAGSLSWLARALDRPNIDKQHVTEAIEDAQEGTRRVLSLIGALADVERAENGQLVVQPSRVSLTAFLDGIGRMGRKHAEARRLSLTIDAAPVEAELDRDLATRVVENLLENAIRYAEEGGKIRLEAQPRGALVEIAVANTGAAIPEHVRARLFEKYARGERRHDAHLGLGLYFCRLAARAHGGDIFVESTPEWPVRFVVRLPLAVQQKKSMRSIAPFAHD